MDALMISTLRATAVLLATLILAATADIQRLPAWEGAPPPEGGVQTPLALTDRTFYIRGLGDRCFDVGAESGWGVGQKVTIYKCNGSVAQKIRVVEIDAATHDVSLRVSGAAFCIGVAIPAGAQLAPGQPLELQVCNGSAAQRFALDGDSVIMGIQGNGQRVSREYVIEPADRSTVQKTRMVVAGRDLSDAQYFRLNATDGSNAPPTSGFARVGTETALNAVLEFGWGSVIELTQSIKLTKGNKVLGEGMTLRGYRKGTDNGPEISLPLTASGPCPPGVTGPCPVSFAFQLENHARITGLRLRGPIRKYAGDFPVAVAGVWIWDLGGSYTDVIVDHLDASDWTDAAVKVDGAFGGFPIEDCSYDGVYPRSSVVKVVGNFLHHNLEGHGYGVAVGEGANPFVRGNVFYQNVHSIAASGAGANAYVAWDNFVTSEAISGKPWTSNQDFDVHGTGDPGHWTGGTSGDIFNIGWNTFLTRKHINFKQRGTPCHYTAFHDNVTVQAENAVQTQSVPPTTLIKTNNKWKAADPTAKLVGADFDGDGISDVFVGTGVTWWFSSGARAEWRLLNRMPDVADNLRFGDFDGDGRSDVLGVQGGRLKISWGGISAWTVVAGPAASIDDVAVGDFDGDRLADIFLADGATWSYAAGAKTWKFLSNSSMRADQLRFGDFTNDGRTDVFWVNDFQWLIFRPDTGGSEVILGFGTSNADGLVVADFDGDGYADVARDYSGAWQYSVQGRADFVNLRTAPSGQKLVTSPVGRFDANTAADAIVWTGINFAIAPGPNGTVKKISRQTMK